MSHESLKSCDMSPTVGIHCGESRRWLNARNSDGSPTVHLGPGMQALEQTTVEGSVLCDSPHATLCYDSTQSFISDMAPCHRSCGTQESGC